MQQMLNTKDLTEDPTRTSAFRPVTPVTKSPKFQTRALDKKRDSGYGSDFSPASVKSVQRKFTFGDDTDADADNMFDDFAAMDFHNIDDEDVFRETVDYGFSAIQELEEGDDTDKEVEELLLNESPNHHAVSAPIDIHRPPAPLPTPESVGEGDNVRPDYNIASPFYHTPWNKRERRKAVRPFVSRSIGTQTPSPHCQLIQDALLSSHGIADPERHFARDHLGLRLRMPSDVETYAKLPDLIPVQRDRSVSCPDVESLRRREQEQHVGRELRRISDAFNTEYSKRHRHSASFPLRGYWDTLRRYVSSSSLFQTWAQTEDR